MNQASVYQIKDKLIFCSSAKTVDGLALSVPPYIHLQKNAESKAIASAIREVLNANQTNVPHPRQNEWADISKRHLTALGVKSLSILHKQGIFCAIYQNDVDLVFSPSKRSTAKGGFEFLPELNVIVRVESSADQIASALTEALQKSEENS